MEEEEEQAVAAQRSGEVVRSSAVMAAVPVFAAALACF